MKIINKLIYLWHRQSYVKYWKKSCVKDNYIFLESQQGKNLNGNIFYIAKELNSSLYDNYEIYLSYSKERKEDFVNLLNNYGLKKIQLVELGSKQYYIKLSAAKYIFNDTSFLTFFIKKPEQIYVNTWHGTPLKTLGKDVKNDRFKIGNIQKNFLTADYILAPNVYTQQKLTESYMLNEIYDGKFLKCGYPRNSVFFDNDRRNKIREQLEFGNKQIIAYMPTWRGIVGQVHNEIDFMEDLLKSIDKNLNDYQVMYVNLHPFMTSYIDFSQYQHIKMFPKQFETYDFLNVADCLITDYSSVFFDFANTKRKIILYVPDEKEYVHERGLYLDLQELPFVKTYNVKQLINEINNSDYYSNESFMKTYCHLESYMTTRQLCQHVLFQNNSIAEVKPQKNGKKNVLIFAGRMVNNGITTSLINLLNYMDSEKYNIIISMTAHNAKEGESFIHALPNYVSYYPHSGKMVVSFLQFIYLGLYYFRLIPRYKSNKIMNHILQYEKQRLYNGMHVDHVINFRGYVFLNIWLFCQFQCKKTIFVHSDMIQEMKNKNNQHPWTLEYAYQHYDNVAVVSEGIKDSTIAISHKSDNIVVCENIIDYKTIENKGKQEMTFDDHSEISVDKQLFIQKMNNSCFTFVNVGRFSKEKGHFRLLEAFKQVHQQFPDTQLLIIGGYGKLYSSLMKKINKYGLNECVFLVKNLSNPLPLVKQCDGFVLSSFYEGFGLVLAEANILNIPIISTDIVGARGFMKKYKGCIYPNNTDGIYQGMLDLYHRKVEIIDVDYQQYNQEAIEQFYSLIDEKSK